MLKQNQIIKDKNGNTRKVLGVCGEVIFVEDYIAGKIGIHIKLETEKYLKYHGYTWEEEKYEPKNAQVYFCISNHATISSFNWQDDEADRAIQSSLGVYPTQEAAEEALREIKGKLNIV